MRTNTFADDSLQREEDTFAVEAAYISRTRWSLKLFDQQQEDADEDDHEQVASVDYDDEIDYGSEDEC